MDEEVFGDVHPEGGGGGGGPGGRGWLGELDYHGKFGVIGWGKAYIAVNSSRGVIVAGYGNLSGAGLACNLVSLRLHPLS